MKEPSPANEPTALPEGAHDAKTRRGKGWVWLFPCGCVVGILFLFGGFAAVMWHNMNAVKKSDAYKVALDTALEHPKVAELLGTHRHPSGWAGGAVDVDAGRAEFGFVLESSRGGGKVACVMTRRDGIWVVEQMTLQLSGSDATHMLVPPPDISPSSERPD